MVWPHEAVFGAQAWEGGIGAGEEVVWYSARAG